MVDAHLDRLALAELQARWCRGVDRGDVELLRSCYDDDARENHGDFTGTGHEFATYIVSLRQKWRTFHHLTGSQLFEIGDQVAVGETYYDFHGVLAGTLRLYKSFGRYLDRYRKQGKDWKITERTVVGDWRGEIATVDPTPHRELGYPSGQLWPGDAVYQMLPSQPGLSDDRAE